MRPLAAAVSVVMFSVSGAANAQDVPGDVEQISRTPVEVGVTQRDFDMFQPSEDILDFDDGQGVVLRGSFAVNDNFFIFGEGYWTESDIFFTEDVSWTFAPNWAANALANAGDEIRAFELGVSFLWD